LNINFPMPKPKEIVLRSSLATEECIRRIQDATDPGQRTLFSLSGYKGSKLLLVKFKGNQFKVWKRRYYRNDFSPYFYGNLSSEGQGTRIEGHFDMDRWVKIFMRIWLGLLIVPSAAVFISTLNRPNRDNAWIGVAIPLGLAAFGIILPNFGRWLGRNEEKYIKEFLETTLLAQPGESQFAVSQRVIENRPL
jgi:hypothetical protein